MVTLSTLRERRADILALARQHGATNVRLFGSTTRGEEKTSRDADFLVQLQPGRSLLDHIAFWQDLEELLGCPVDVVDEAGLSPFLRDRVLAEARPL